MSSDLQTSLAPVLGRVPSGVFVLVAGDGSGRKTGMLASWVQQASFVPPQITIAVNKSRYLIDWLLPGAPVSINQIAKGDNSLFRHFSKGFEPDANAFADLEQIEGSAGLPLLTAAMASMEGVISGEMEAGDHRIFLVTLTHAVAHRDVSEFDPFVHVRKNGFAY